MSYLDHYLAVFYAPSFPNTIKLKTWSLYTEKRELQKLQGLLLGSNSEFRGWQQSVGICSCLNCKYSLARALATIVIQNKSYLDHAVPDSLRDKLYLKEFIKDYERCFTLGIFLSWQKQNQTLCTLKWKAVTSSLQTSELSWKMKDNEKKPRPLNVTQRERGIKKRLQTNTQGLA